MWEYKLQESEDHKAFAIEANKLGADGWELVSLQNMSGFAVAFFKRPISPLSVPKWVQKTPEEMKPGGVTYVSSI